MANQHTAKKQAAHVAAILAAGVAIPTPDAAFSHVNVGPSNEELLAKQLELDALRAASGYPKVEMGLDQKEKDLDAWGDLDHDPLGTRDPLEALKRQYQKPGFAVKLLSSTVNARLGTRDYRIVKDRAGDPVRFGTMVLGEIPERIALRRRNQVVKDSQEELSHITDESAQAVEALRAQAKGMGLELLRPGETVNKHGVDHAMGVSVERGEGPPEQ
jgi:hypothetical protein